MVRCGSNALKVRAAVCRKRQALMYSSSEKRPGSTQAGREVCDRVDSCCWIQKRDCAGTTLFVC